MKKILWTIIFVLLVAATLSACSSEKFPTGKYTYDDASVEYRDDGTFTLMKRDKVVNEGTYSVQGDEIQFTDSYCQDANPGTYKWQYEDDKLNCELIEDPCEGRVSALSHYWFGPK